MSTYLKIRVRTELIFSQIEVEEAADGEEVQGTVGYDVC